MLTKLCKKGLISTQNYTKDKYNKNPLQVKIMLIMIRMNNNTNNKIILNKIVKNIKKKS